MSHSTVLVVVPAAAIEKAGGPDNIDDALAEILEPFDENKDTPEYIRKTKAQLIADQRAEYERYRDKGAYAEYLADPAKYREQAAHNPAHLKYLTEEFPTYLDKLDDEDFLYEKATEYDKRSLDAEGNLLSTYNPKSFRLKRVTTNPDDQGLVLSSHDQREEADQSAGDEVLFEVRGDEAAGGVPAGEAIPRRTVHVLHTLHKGAEQGADAGAAPGLAHQVEVQDGGRGVRHPAGQAGGSVLDLQAGAGGSAAGGGSLPYHGAGAWLTVHDLQPGTRFASGLAIVAGSRDELPAAPTGWTWGSEVSGSKWDWYSVGGRWDGCVMNWTEEVEMPAKQYTPTYTEPAWIKKSGGVNAVQKKDLEKFAGTFAFLDGAGEWHEKGHMGWFGMVSDEQDPNEWDAKLKQLVEDVPDEDWLVVVDVHI